MLLLTLPFCVLALLVQGVALAGAEPPAPGVGAAVGGEAVKAGDAAELFRRAGVRFNAQEYAGAAWRPVPCAR